MSRTYRNYPHKIYWITWLKSKEKVENCYMRDGFSSKESPTKVYKKQFNQKFRTRQKRLLQQEKAFDRWRKSHLWQWV